MNRDFTPSTPVRVQKVMSQQAQTNLSTSSAAPQAVASDSLIQVLWRRRLTVGIVVAVAIFASIGYLLTATRQYTATSKIYIEFGGPQLISQTNTTDRPSENYLNTQCELIRSTPILSLALGTLEDQSLKTLQGVGNRFDYLQKHLTVSPGKNDDLIYVSFEGPDAVEASILTNSIVDAYVTYQASHRKSTTAEALTILRNEMDKRDAELATKSQQLLELRRQAGVLTSTSADQNNPLLQRLTTLTQALTAAHVEAINAKSAYEQGLVSLNGDTAKLQQVQQSQGVALSTTDEEMARSELFRLQQQLVELRRQYMAEHPSVRTIEARIDQLRIALVVTARQRWLAARQKEADLQQNVDQQQKLALDRSVLTAEYERLQDEIKRLEQRNLALDGRIKDLSLTENSGALDINVLQQAIVPTRASSPSLPRTMAVGLAGGLILALGAALAREWTDRRLRSIEEMKNALGISVLGVVPQMPAALTPLMKGLRVHQDPSSNVAEAYRSLRTAIYFGLRDQEARTILVTSPTPNDGKSTVAANLAIAMAQAGQRVLLVDADLRKPSLQGFFGIDSTRGLCNLLSGDEDVRKDICATRVYGLSLLPCGERPANPSEILNSQRFSDLLGDLAMEYDQVVIDSPPVNVVADARIIGAAADVSLLVVNAAHCDRRLAEMARDGLLSVGANVLGVVVNAATSGSGFTTGGYGQGYGYVQPPIRQVHEQDAPSRSAQATTRSFRTGAMTGLGTVNIERSQPGAV